MAWLRTLPSRLSSNYGPTFEWGTCKGAKKKLFGGTTVCGARGFEQVYADRSRLTVSFDDRPLDERLT